MTRSSTPPILLVIFNRPDTTAKVFASIRQAKPPKLYIASDGPRPSSDADITAVLKSRQIAQAVDWHCEVETLFRKKNLGCAQAVKTAIDWFFSKEDFGIILEDDTVPTSQFYPFCQELLLKYADDTRIAMIAGTNHLGYKPKYASYVFSRNKACWGWATWRRAWKNMDFEMKWRTSAFRENIIKNMGLSDASYRHWTHALGCIDKGQVSAWDWPWYFSIAAQSQLTIFPAANLVANIGFGENATHTKGIASDVYLSVHDLEFPIVHPELICPDYTYDQLFEDVKMAIPLKQRVKSGIGKMLPQRLKKMIKAAISYF